MYGRVAYDSQRLYLNGSFIEGVTDHSSSFSSNKTDLLFAGTGYLQSVSEGEQGGEFSFSRVLSFDNDLVTGMFNGDVSGKFLYGVREEDFQVFNFERGRISSYNISCEVGGIASSDIQVTCFGNMGGNGTEPYLPEYNYTNPKISISRALNLDVAGSSTNRVQSIDYSIQVNYSEEPFLSEIESSTTQIKVNYPVLIESTFVLDVDDYSSSRVFDLLCSAPTQNLNFSFDDCQYGITRKFYSPNAELSDISYTSSLDGNMQYTLTYQSKIKNLSSIGAILSLNV